MPALEWLGEDFSGRYGLEVHVEADHELEFTEERVRVILFRAGDLVRITDQDAGTGFDIADIDRHGHGLLGIREQLKFIGGMLSVESSPGSGTVVTRTAPHSSPPMVATG